MPIPISITPTHLNPPKEDTYITTLAVPTKNTDALVPSSAGPRVLTSFGVIPVGKDDEAGKSRVGWAVVWGFIVKCCILSFPLGG